MGDLKTNDLSKDASEPIKYENAYKITITSYGNKVTMSLDTKLDQNLGSLKDMLQLARQNGIQWFLETWVTDDKGKRKLQRSQATLDQIPKIG